MGASKGTKMMYFVYRTARHFIRGLALVVWVSGTLALWTLPAAAQSSAGNIAGYVKDISGAAIPGVTVTARMVEQQTVRTVQTNAEGFYDLLALPPGRYEMTFEDKGFQRLT